MLSGIEKDIRRKRMLERAENIEGGDEILKNLEIDKHGQAWGSLSSLNKTDPTLLESFPKGTFKNEDQVEAATIAKLRGDEVAYVRNLVNKYGDDFLAMAKDIKVNVMQWSRGECKKMHSRYFAHGMDKK